MELYSKIDNLYADNTTSTINPISEQVLDDSKVQKELKELNDRFIITIADKAQNTYMIVCKCHAYRLIDEEITNSGTYSCPTQVLNMEACILQSHYDFHQKHKLSTSPP